MYKPKLKKRKERRRIQNKDQQWHSRKIRKHGKANYLRIEIKRMFKNYFGAVVIFESDEQPHVLVYVKDNSKGNLQ